MLGILDLLVFFQHVSEYVRTYWEIAKETARKYLGPSPNTTYLVFDNDEVIATGKEHCKYSHIAQYSPQECRITDAKSTAPYKRLPWVSVHHVIGDHIIDLSDWLAEIRANTPITLLALLRLSSFAMNTHLPETENAKIIVITRDGEGEEEEYKYMNGKLLRRIQPKPVEIQHRPTCPYDMEGGLFF